MPEYVAPGVYVEELERGPRPIEGVPTSTAAFLGETERGPLRPRLVTSYNDYSALVRQPCSPTAGTCRMPSRGFFENGGKRLYVCRIVGDGATTASRAFGDFTVTAAGPGAWGRRVWVRIQDGSTGTGRQQRLQTEARVLVQRRGRLPAVRSVRSDEQRPAAEASAAGGLRRPVARSERARTFSRGA